MVGTMLLNQLLAIVFGFDSEILSTYNLLTAGAISMAVLVYVCSAAEQKEKAALHYLRGTVCPGAADRTGIVQHYVIVYVAADFCHSDYLADYYCHETACHFDAPFCEVNLIKFICRSCIEKLQIYKF